MEKLETSRAHGSSSGHNYLHAGLILFGLLSFVVSAGMSGYNGTGLGYPDGRAQYDWIFLWTLYLSFTINPSLT